jgi:hypothetical protein
MRDRTIAKRVKSFSVAAPALLLILPDFVSLNSVDEWFHQQPPSQELLLSVLRLLDGLIVFTVGLYDATQYPPRPQFDPGTMIVTWAVFQTLAEVAGATLRRLCVEVFPPLEIQSPLLLEPFVALRSLEWKCAVEFSLDSPKPVGILANLECLSLVGYHPSLLDILAAAELSCIY